MKRTIFLMAFLIAMVNTFAQNGVIVGVVKDAQTGELLPGTNVVISGTQKGAVTDLNGNFQLSDLPAGTYKISVTFISYTPLETEVVISESDTIELKVNLGSAATKIQGVNIIAKRNDRTENAMIVMQKKSGSVVNGISSQEMKKSGESTAAGALKKVTGVSVQDGKFVYVRGLSDRYSKTTLNGAEIPGLDPKRNTVQMDLFPAAALKNILVHKSFSPDITGDFTGGLIDLRTVDIPNKFSVNFSVQTAFNPQANLNKNFLTYQGGSTDFLGFDDGTRAVPTAAALGDIPNRYENDPKLNEVTRSFNKIWTPDTKLSGLDQKYSFSIGNQLVKKGKTLGYFFSTQYEHSTKYYDDGFYGRYQLISANDENLNRQLESSQYVRGQQDAISTVMGGIGYEFNPQNRINLMVMNSHSGVKAANYMVFQDFRDDSRHRERRVLEFSSRNIFTTQLKGHHDLRDFHGIKINWLGSFTSANQNEPDIRYLQNDIIPKNNGDTVYLVNPSLYSNPRRFYRNMIENVYFARVDFEMDYSAFNQESKLKFGFSNGFKNTDYQQKQFLFAENIKGEYHDINDFFADENIDAQNGIFAQNSKQDDKLNSYFGYQNVFAAYAMTSMNITNKIKAVYGLRVEKVNMHTESYKEAAGTEVLSGGLDELNLLPSINLTASPTKKLNIRFGFNRTLARPSFREKAPLTIENREGDIMVGNPELKQTLINNYDFRIEKYMKSGEVISVGAFYKNFINPIEQTFNTEALNPEITWRNVDRANLYGLEAELSKKLSFIPGMKNFKITTNTTYVYSRITIDEKELVEKRRFDPYYPAERQMTEQSPWIVNALFSYQNDSLGLDMNISYTYNDDKLAFINSRGIPDIMMKATNDLNFNITKKLGKSFSLTFKVKNILNKRNTKYYDYSGEQYIYSDYGWGRVFSLKFSYKL